MTQINKIHFAQYIYTLYVLCIFLISFILIIPLFFISFILGKYQEPYLQKLFRLWSWGFQLLVGIIPKIDNRSNYHHNGKYIIIANHISFLDTPLVYCSVPFSIKILARSDYGNIPIFGILYKKMTIGVDRSSIASKRDSYIKMINTIKADSSSLFIFPEGSFNESESIVKKFYDGAFKIAWETQTPILPLAFLDTYKRWHYSSFWKWSPGINRSIILPTLQPKDFNNVNELKEAASNIIQKSLIENNYKK